MEQQVDIGIWRMNVLERRPGGKLLAYFDLAYGEMIIKGYRIVDGTRGMFVGGPREQGKNNQYYDIIQVSSPILQKRIEDLALKTYKERLNDRENPASSNS